MLPAGFTAAAHGAEAVPVTVLGSVDQPVGAQVGAAIAESFVAQLNAVRLSVVAALAAGAPPEQLPQLAAQAAQRRLPEEVSAQPLGAKPLKAISYYGPGMGIFFALFAVGFTARSFFTERHNGTQADGIASILTFTLVLLGGNFVFISAAPAALRRLALLTPNGWALRGFTDLATGARGWLVVAQPVLAILIFSVVTAVLAAALTRRAVSR